MIATPPKDLSANAVPFVQRVDHASACGQTMVSQEAHLGALAWTAPRSDGAFSSSVFQINPYEIRTWTDRDEREFTDLAFKKACYQTTTEDDVRFRQMVAARRRDIPQRSTEQILLTAERDQLLLEMKDILQKYHNFRIKLGPYHEAHSSGGNHPQAQLP